MESVSNALGDGRSAANALAVLLIGLLLQGVPSGLMYLHAMQPGMGPLMYLVWFVFFPTGGIAAALWLIVGFGISLRVRKSCGLNALSMVS
ncbi:MAG: hypothetical protein ACOY6K_13430 [Pseudomonadota bacterium]